jgi:hypothetical protein
MNHDINKDRVEELITEYIDATSDKKRREIETDFLQETLWKVRRDDQPFAQYTEEELRLISDALDDDAEKANMLTRRPFVKKL